MGVVEAAIPLIMALEGPPRRLEIQNRRRISDGLAPDFALKQL